MSAVLHETSRHCRFSGRRLARQLRALEILSPHPSRRSVPSASTHPDPSSSRCLTARRPRRHGQFDFVIFPERWLVAEHSFPAALVFPQTMNVEFHGPIYAVSDSKEEGFVRRHGSCTTHACPRPYSDPSPRPANLPS